MLDENTKKTILEFQSNEITEYYIYRALARLARTEHNRKVMNMKLALYIRASTEDQTKEGYSVEVQSV